MLYLETNPLIISTMAVCLGLFFSQETYQMVGAKTSNKQQQQRQLNGWNP